MSKLYDGVIGLVVGDALGVPVEFETRDTYTVTDMIGYGTYNQPAGTWSDDSSMTLAAIESIGRLGRIDLEDIMHNFVKWSENGEFTPYNDVFDIGMATRRAIRRFQTGSPVEECGGNSFLDNGNGALMRILPLAFLPNVSNDEVEKIVGLTHRHGISQFACKLYVEIGKNLRKGMDKQNAVDAAIGAADEIPAEYKRIKNIRQYPRDAIKSSGYVVDTLEAALWCFLTTDNYKDCVLKAVNLGGDTDTIAAVSGGLAGICYGCCDNNGIPDEWIRQIPRQKWIFELCGKFKRNCQ